MSYIIRINSITLQFFLSQFPSHSFLISFWFEFISFVITKGDCEEECMYYAQVVYIESKKKKWKWKNFPWIQDLSIASHFFTLFLSFFSSTQNIPYIIPVRNREETHIHIQVDEGCRRLGRKTRACVFFPLIYFIFFT